MTANKSVKVSQFYNMNEPHIVGLEALSNKPIVGYYMSIV